MKLALMIHILLASIFFFFFLVTMSGVDDEFLLDRIQDKPEPGISLRKIS